MDEEKLKTIELARDFALAMLAKSGVNEWNDENLRWEIGEFSVELAKKIIKDS